MEYNQPREQLFSSQPYQYNQNPFNHLATASWDAKDHEQHFINGKPKQIVLVRTLEPDKLGKSKRQVAKEFLAESSCNQVYHGRKEDQADLQVMLLKQQ